MSDVLEYAATTKDADYARYFAYAGLRLDAASTTAPGAYLGLNTHLQDPPPGAGRGGRGGVPEGILTVTSVTGGSPAASAGLEAGDVILEIDGLKASPKVINDVLGVTEASGRGGRGTTPPSAAIPAKNPGEKIAVKILRGGEVREVPVELKENFRKAYTIRPAENPSTLQAAILKSWL